jgi:hypothetical protein
MYSDTKSRLLRSIGHFHSSLPYVPVLTKYIDRNFHTPQSPSAPPPGLAVAKPTFIPPPSAPFSGIPPPPPMATFACGKSKLPPPPCWIPPPPGPTGFACPPNIPRLLPNDQKLPSLDDLIRNLDGPGKVPSPPRLLSEEKPTKGGVWNKPSILSSEQILCCSAFVKGFILAERKWGSA